MNTVKDPSMFSNSQTRAITEGKWVSFKTHEWPRVHNSAATKPIHMKEIYISSTSALDVDHLDQV